jgi:hypothetical protein
MSSTTAAAAAVRPGVAAGPAEAMTSRGRSRFPPAASVARAGFATAGPSVETASARRRSHAASATAVRAACGRAGAGERCWGAMVVRGPPGWRPSVLSLSYVRETGIG